MTGLYIAIAVVVLLFVIYLLMLKGRTNHKDLPKLRGWHYAHRGLHSEGIPENSMAAFRAAKEAGYGIGLSAARAICGNFGGKLTAEYPSAEAIRFTARF